MVPASRTENSCPLALAAALALAARGQALRALHQVDKLGRLFCDLVLVHHVPVTRLYRGDAENRFMCACHAQTRNTNCAKLRIINATESCARAFQRNRTELWVQIGQITPGS
jgi:hypothetical protein